MMFDNKFTDYLRTFHLHKGKKHLREIAGFEIKVPYSVEFHLGYEDGKTLEFILKRTDLKYIKGFVYGVHMAIDDGGKHES